MINKICHEVHYAIIISTRRTKHFNKDIWTQIKKNYNQWKLKHAKSSNNNSWNIKFETCKKEIESERQTEKEKIGENKTNYLK